MKTSLKGILAIINEEALVLSTYRDAAGVPTIGAGHTAAAGGMAPNPDIAVPDWAQKSANSVNVAVPSS